VIAAANQVAGYPYVYGGGHATFEDTAYDCSGSVSFALAAAGLLRETMASTGFESYGAAGRASGSRSTRTRHTRDDGRGPAVRHRAGC